MNHATIQCPDCNLQFTADATTRVAEQPSVAVCINCGSHFDVVKHTVTDKAAKASISSIQPLNRPAAVEPASAQTTSSAINTEQFNLSALSEIDLSQDVESLTSKHLHQDAPEEFLEEPEYFWDEMPDPYAKPEPEQPEDSAQAESTVVKPTINQAFHFENPNLSMPLLSNLPDKRQKLWLIGSLLALGTLVLQLIYFNVERLADSSMRPLAAGVCSILPCQLPAQVDIQQIVTQSLSIRPHPSAPSTLSLNAIVINQAPFVQPFPRLLLSFKDPQGNNLLTLNYRPQDYLAGELAGQQIMPAQVPIQIALDVVDFDSQVTQYQLSFY